MNPAEKWQIQCDWSNSSFLHGVDQKRYQTWGTIL